MSIYLLLFTVTTPIGESCYSLTQRNLNTFCLSPSRHPSESRTCYPPTQHNLYNSKYLYFSPSRHPSESRMCYPHTQHNLYIPKYLLLFTVNDATHLGVVHVTHSLNTASTSPDIFPFHRHANRRKVVYMLPTHSTQPLHLQRPFPFPRHATRRTVVRATHSTQPLHLQRPFTFPRHATRRRAVSLKSRSHDLTQPAMAA